METHPDIKRLAEPFWAGALSENADRAVQEHAENCESCATRLLAARPAPRSSGPARRAIKILISSVALVSLVLLGAFFQDGFWLGADAALLSGEEQPCLSVPMRKPAMASGGAPYFSGDGKVRAGESTARGGGAGAAAAAAPRDPFAEEAKLIRQAELQLQVAGFDPALIRVGEIAAAEQGFLSGIDIKRLESGLSAGSLTVRVPSRSFDAVLGKLRSLGVVLHQNLKTRDVTKTYLDLKSRLGAKETLLERLKKMLLEAPGTVKELLEVEVQIGRTVEEIEVFKGELQFHDNQIDYATIVLWLTEKESRPPAEIVETIDAALALAVRDAEPAYAQAQKILLDAGGHLIDAQFSLEGDNSAWGRIKGSVDAGKFPHVRASLRKLGHVAKDRVDRRRLGGNGPEGATLRSEQAALEIVLSTLPARVTRTLALQFEVPDVDTAYQAARRAFEEAGANLTEGTLRIAATDASATLYSEVNEDRTADLLARLAPLGTQRNSETGYTQPAGTGTPVRERVRFEVRLSRPVAAPVEESSLARAASATWSGSVAGLFWSVERLFVGLALASPWAALGLIAWAAFRRLRRRKSISVPAPLG